MTLEKSLISRERVEHVDLEDTAAAQRRQHGRIENEPEA
jgi:hypothetical protein